MLHNHQGCHQWGASRWDLIHAVRTVCDAGRCFGISDHLYRSDLLHLGANKVVLKLPQLCNHQTQLPMPSGGRGTCNSHHKIEYSSLFTLQYFECYKRVISTGKLKIYTIDGSKYCAKNKCNTVWTPPWRYKHPSCGANRSSDVGVTVNINTEYNLIAINRIIKCISSDLGTKYCQVLESCAVYTAPPVLSKRSLVAQVGVYLASRCIWMRRQLFLQYSCGTSISDWAFTKPSPWHNSGCTQCCKCS
jgi:hypothetical protein